MKFISWNVDGLRACLKKGFIDFYQGEKPDFCCLQETKMEQGQADVDLGEGILEYWNSAEKKGYSGTAVFTPHTSPCLSATVWTKTTTTTRGGSLPWSMRGSIWCAATPQTPRMA